MAPADLASSLLIHHNAEARPGKEDGTRQHASHTWAAKCDGFPSNSILIPMPLYFSDAAAETHQVRFL